MPQLVIMIGALVAIVMWFHKASRAAKGAEGKASFPAQLLAMWIVASAVFHAHFYVIRPAGIFDITIERALFFLLLLFLVAGWFQGKVRFDRGISIEIVMGFFALLCFLSMLRTGFLPAAPEFPSPWYVFISGYLFPFIVFVYAKHYLVGEKDVTVVLHALFYFGLYLSVISFFEYADLRQYVFPRYINDPLITPMHLERARGPFLNAAFNGMGIIIGFISGLHLLEKKEGAARTFHGLALLLFFPGVFFTQTRSIYLGMIITVIIFLRWYKTAFSKWKLVSMPLALALIFFMAVSPRLMSPDRRAGGVYQVHEVSIRMALLERSFFLFSQYPITGIGLAQFIPVSVRAYKGPVATIMEEIETQFQHNHLLGIATEMGIPGIMLYLALVIMIFWRLKLLSRILPRMGIISNNLCVAIFALWCAYLTNNLFLEPSLNIFVNSVPFLFAGLADGIYTRAKQTGGYGKVSFPKTGVTPATIKVVDRHV